MTRKRLEIVLLSLLGIGYVVADLWLYKASGLPLVNAILLDVPITIVFGVTAALTSGFTERATNKQR